MNDTLSIKVTAAEKALLRTLAEKRGVKIATVIREAIQLLAKETEVPSSPSFYELGRTYFETPGLIGESGKRDLSTNKAYLSSFGK